MTAIILLALLILMLICLLLLTVVVEIKFNQSINVYTPYFRQADVSEARPKRSMTQMDVFTENGVTIDAFRLQMITFVTFVDLLLFSSFSDIPGASRIKTCDKSRIKT